MISFSDFAKTRKTILFDGATGSNLLSEDSSEILPDILSLKRPGRVLALHEEYLDAGCDVVETNSFNSNPLVFESFGLKKPAFECAKISAVLAKKAADKFSTPEKPRFAAGSIGPVFNQNGSLQLDEALLFEAYSVQITAVLMATAGYLVFLIFCRENRIMAILQLITIVGYLFDISWYFFGIEEFGVTVSSNIVIRLLTLVSIFIFEDIHAIAPPSQEIFSPLSTSQITTGNGSPSIE